MFIYAENKDVNKKLAHFKKFSPSSITFLVGSIYDKRYLYPKKIATKCFSTVLTTIRYSQ